MKITIDGQCADTEQTDLAALLDVLGHEPARVATALNGTFVPREARADTELGEGDAIDIVVPIGGG